MSAALAAAVYPRNLRRSIIYILKVNGLIFLWHYPEIFNICITRIIRFPCACTKQSYLCTDPTTRFGYKITLLVTRSFFYYSHFIAAGLAITEFASTIL